MTCLEIVSSAPNVIAIKLSLKIGSARNNGGHGSPWVGPAEERDGLGMTGQEDICCRSYTKSSHAAHKHQFEQSRLTPGSKPRRLWCKDCFGGFSRRAGRIGFSP